MEALRSVVVAALRLPHHQENSDAGADAKHDRDDDDGSKKACGHSDCSAKCSANCSANVQTLALVCTRT